MGLIEGISEQVRSVTINDNVSRIVDASIKKQRKIDPRPSDYFYLTELVNPIQAYWQRTRRDIELPRELTKKFAVGTKLGRISGLWFRKLPGFVTQEARLDGAYVGINGVVGKIDYRIGESIIEFKTKPEQVLDIDTIFNRFPQDLEQLLFYVALSSKATDTHYLVFMTDYSPYSLTVFKIKIKNLGDIKSLLKKRKGDLRRALESEDAKYLKRCRYLDFECAYKGGICDCENRPIANVEVIKRNIEILRDGELENQLEEIRQADGTQFDEVFPFWSLLTPRRWFIQTVLGEKEEYEKPYEQDRAEILLSTSVFWTDDLRLTEKEIKNLKDSEVDFPVRVPHSRFIKLKGSGSDGPTEELVPYVARAYLGRARPRPHDYHIAELGISCAKFGKSRGVAFAIYPEVSDYVVAYVITYGNTNEIKASILTNVANLSEAEKEKNLGILDMCPDWMCRSCDHTSYCTSP